MLPAMQYDYSPDSVFIAAIFFLYSGFKRIAHKWISIYAIIKDEKDTFSDYCVSSQKGGFSFSPEKTRIGKSKKSSVSGFSRLPGYFCDSLPDGRFSF